MSARTVKQQLKALAEDNRGTAAGQSSAKVTVQKKRGKRGKKAAAAGKGLKSKKAPIAKPPLPARERNLRYFKATAQQDARTRQLMRKVLGLPEGLSEDVDETDEDLLTLFG
mmetsp:Transcript_20642/g.62191  ORF Transcript_20642/g.62191 Transcript_20642/m.62191 type:complete len:112 (-) Transcript_20642:1734-2069(-)